MKKIISLICLMFVLVSCGEEKVVDNLEIQNKLDLLIVENTELKNKLLLQEKKILEQEEKLKLNNKEIENLKNKTINLDYFKCLSENILKIDKNTYFRKLPPDWEKFYNVPDSLHKNFNSIGNGYFGDEYGYYYERYVKNCGRGGCSMGYELLKILDRNFGDDFKIKLFDKHILLINDIVYYKGLKLVGLTEKDLLGQIVETDDFISINNKKYLKWKNFENIKYTKKELKEDI